jgi:hypothetical protein
MSLRNARQSLDAIRNTSALALMITCAACNTSAHGPNTTNDGTMQPTTGTGGAAVMSAAPPTAGAGGSSTSGAAAGTGGSANMNTSGTAGTGMHAAGTGGSGSADMHAMKPAADAGKSKSEPTDAGDAGADAAADRDAAPPPHMDLGMGDGSDVVLLGDSWMSNTLQIEGTGGGIAPALIAASGQPYANYGVQGVMLLMADTFGPAIPTQYETAKQIHPGLKTVVMTGGGNDIIQNPTVQQSCMTGGDDCKQLLMQIGAALNTLWSEMADDGVQDVVYIRYSEASSSVDPSLKDAVGTPMICLSGRIRCHAVSTTDLVSASDLAADGIHPLYAANMAIAQRVVDLMKSQGMRR